MKAYFSQSEKPKVPMLDVTVYNPPLNKKVRLNFIIDTGFAGGILIPLDTYVSLNLHLFESTKKVGKLATGITIELRVSKAILDFDGIKIPCHAYTSLGVSKNLLGREVLEKIKLTCIPKQDKMLVEVDP
ncbi:MAG: hypothetical protein DRJ35_05645 [Thermoprotei archaeon]|nr:MAG: hypothetical protein DRJ35_05645 [Thermoprotei archaeon]